MRKNFLVVFVIVICCIFICGTASAGGFTTLLSTGMLHLGDDEAWVKNYDTRDGKFKVQFRKLLFASDKKKYHLIIWRNGDRITDGYCPQNSYGYEFKMFQDSDSDRIFLLLETKRRAVLLGYEPQTKKMEKYADSKDYYSSLPYPSISVDEDNDLQLVFVGANSDMEPFQYKLSWDAETNWFGYRDVTVHREMLEEEPTMEAANVPANDVEMSGELYYEEVIGS